MNSILETVVLLTVICLVLLLTNILMVFQLKKKFHELMIELFKIDTNKKSPIFSGKIFKKPDIKKKLIYNDDQRSLELELETAKTKS